MVRSHGTDQVVPKVDVAVDTVPCPLRIMLSQVGVREETGHNDGIQVQLFLGSVKLSGDYPWCAALPYWSYKQCGCAPEPAREYAAAARWHRTSQRIWERKGWTPDTADVFRRISIDGDHGALYYANLGRIGHEFMITGEDEDYFNTVEGNTDGSGTREGDGVYIRRRLKKTVHCISRHPCPVTSSTLPLASL